MAEEHELEDAAGHLTRTFPADRAAGQSADIAALCGIRDAKVLDRLLALGVTAETLPALSLYPLVAVAWADGRVQRAERRAILDAARDNGLDEGSPAYEILSANLADTPPAPGVADAWANYAVALNAHLDDKQREIIRNWLLGRARAIALAARGHLGLEKRISDAEAAVLRELEGAFK